MSWTQAWAAALIDELSKAGVRDVVISPGSRSAPLTLATHAEPRLRDHHVLDERSAGFVALGLASSTGRPTALICTSGTAAANYLPAVIEASLSQVPLILLTADRPHELRDCGAPQTVPQVGLYGDAVRWQVDLPTPGPEVGLWRHLRRSANRAVAEALHPGAGPVHLNVPLRDPLSPGPEDLPEPKNSEESGHALTEVSMSLPAPDTQLADELCEFLLGETDGLIVVGPMHIDPTLTRSLARCAEHCAWPILGEPLSQQRGAQEPSRFFVDAHDALFRVPSWVQSRAPRRILRFGSPPTSKAMNQWLADSKARTWVVDPFAWKDPDATAERILRCDPTALTSALQDRFKAEPLREESTFTKHWADAGALARTALNQGLDDRFELSEPEVIRSVAEATPDGSAVFLGNSMPVRDADTFWPASPKGLRFFGNRGANGIDGTLSTLVGISRGHPAETLGVIGDLSLLHDWTGLLSARASQENLTVVVVDNAGGGIFEFLPVAKRIERSAFEAHFGTDQGVDLTAALEGFGIRCQAPASPTALRASLKDAFSRDGTDFVVVRTERRTNQRLHQELFERVAAELGT